MVLTISKLRGKTMKNDQSKSKEKKQHDRENF